MKRFISTIAILLVVAKLHAQEDTTKSSSDTLKVGDFIIIKKNKNPDTKDNNPKQDKSALFNIQLGSRNKSKNRISTNWLIVDIGFANLREETQYGSADVNNYARAIRPGESAFTKEDLKLKTTKSSNVNLWFFMQRLNVIKRTLNLKYGLGLEMYNFRYTNNISYQESPAFIFRDSVDFSKNKLYAGYITIPFMINVNATPHKRNGFSFSAGVSAGYLIGSRNKQISKERGKQKIKGDFDLEPWRVAAIGELGLGPVRLYGSYSINALHQKGLQQYPYAVGVRLSSW